MRLKSRFRRKIKRKVPELNTTSTADISFMLLIFFLVTTSMDHDNGMRRQLPPADNQKEQKPNDVDRNKVMTITITANGKYAIEDQQDVTDKEIINQAAEFIKRLGKEHIIEIVADDKADYNSYFHLHNVLQKAYVTARHDSHKDIPQRISETIKAGMVNQKGGNQ